MLDRLFSSGSLPALESLLYFASDRQRLIAGNIANVDTVGYRTRDLPGGGFDGALARALGETSEAEPFGRPGGEPAELGVLKPGGNTVDLEEEMAKLVRTHELHSLVAGLLASQFTLLREAFAGHVIS